MTTDDFRHSPLITPERLASDHKEAFSILPPGFHALGFATVGPDIQPVPVAAFGKRHVAHPAFTLLALATVCELCRAPTVSLVTDHDGQGRIYARVALGTGSGNLNQLSRVLYGAGEFEEMRRTGKRSGFRPGEHYKTTGQQRSEDSRQVALRYVRARMEEWEESGTMPSHFTAATYLENLERLFQMLDLETQGSDLLPALQLIRTEGEAA